MVGHGVRQVLGKIQSMMQAPGALHLFLRQSHQDLTITMTCQGTVTTGWLYDLETPCAVVLTSS
jgi:hypothetical protein